MTEEEFSEIFNNFITPLKYKGDNALTGLNIIFKYLPDRGIEAAEHGVIYGAGVKELADAGITLEDVKKLKELNWMIDNGYMSCFI